uniref:Uncharacterized protein n=1 Tax=Anguilla anguilla TaxID=7936 RepID=A0A0E9TX70_ANGAN
MFTLNRGRAALYSAKLDETEPGLKTVS